MKHYVYRIDDLITGEYYFGSRSCNCKIEDDNYMGSMKTWEPEDKSRLVKTILKSNFRKRETAIKYESKIIKENIDDTLNRNYHVPNSGFHVLGLPRSKTTRDKIAKGLIGNTNGIGHGVSDEHRAKISKLKKGKPISQSVRDKISKSLMGRVTSDDTRQKLSDVSRSYWESISPDERKRLCVNFKHDTPHTEETKQKLRDMKLGLKHSDETKKKMSESHKGIIKDETWRENLSKSLKNKPKSKQHIQKLRECHKIPVLQYTKDDEFIKEWDGAIDAHRELKINHISSVCKGKMKTAGGFIWKYKNIK